jgi:capsular exopolysaccharide synthesis family protein
MGKVYEALQRPTGNRQQCIQSKKASDQFLNRLPNLAEPDSESLTPGEYESIKTNFLARYRHLPIKSILFSGVSPGCGASTAAANFAACLANDSGLNVLLVDANLRSPFLHRFFPSSGRGLLDYLLKADSKRFEIKKAGSDGLYLLNSGGAYDHPAQLFETKRFHQFLDKVHAAMDFVILDGPLPSAYPESKALCGKVDGVVLVVEAGKSRRQAALQIKKEFEAIGGLVLGTILNKRKYHIPNWLYRRL